MSTAPPMAGQSSGPPARPRTQSRPCIYRTVDAEDGPGASGGVADFWRRLAVALVRARRERAGLLAALELDAMNDDGPGAIVGPDDDPVADALDELRRKCRGEALE